jgi:protein gp37
MGDRTTIEWTRGEDGSAGATWNPVTGCTQVSPGCDHCYALTLAERFRGTPGHYFENGFDVQLRPDKLGLPLRWKKARKVFVNSMSDLFHDQVPTDYIEDVFAVMAAARQHTFQLLTKRHARMRNLLNQGAFWANVYDKWRLQYGGARADNWAKPLPNVWLGVSVENQHWADIRIPALLDTPAAVRWLSCEPLLGPVDLKLLDYYEPDHDSCSGILSPAHEPSCGVEPGEHWGINWVVAGGESGRNARPMHPDWARTLRDQCQQAGVPFLFKQWGEWAPDGYVGMGLRQPGQVYVPDSTVNCHPGEGAGMARLGKKAAGRELDGRVWDEYPEAVPA